MTVRITFPPMMEAEFRKKAAASGKDVTEFVLDAVKEKLKTPETLAQLLAPIHEHTRRTGITEDEIEALVEEVREEARSEKNGRNE